jgi:hypothetical protein
MKKLLIVFLGLFLALYGSVEAKAQDFRQDPFSLRIILEPPTSAELDTLANQLQLSDAQRSQMQNKLQKHQGDIQKLQTDFQNAQNDLSAALTQQPEPAPGRVENALRAAHRTQRELIDKQMALWNDLSDNLSQQQTQEFWRVFARNRLPNQQGPAQPYYYYPRDRYRDDRYQGERSRQDRY